jgi:hypothetical protein
MDFCKVCAMLDPDFGNANHDRSQLAELFDEIVEE